MAKRLRPAVRRFAELMEERLRANDHKGHWDGCCCDWLLDRIRDETEELSEAIMNPDLPREAVLREAADVANFAMMIADNHR